MKILITGGSGFIGSALIRSLVLNHSEYKVLNIDNLTYASNKNALNGLRSCSNYEFQKIDICNYESLLESINQFLPDRVIHLAAESHVDNSISNPFAFIQTNILGTFNLLEIIRKLRVENRLQDNFIFHHVSTDEVFGDLELDDDKFTENHQYMPSSPYSASKASSDHLVRSWGRTYGINYLITNCSNNFGPFQHKEKLIPKIIISVIEKKSIPIFGNGKQIRDWLYVDDHVDAIHELIKHSIKNDTFNIGANNEIHNIDLVHNILELMVTKFGFSKEIYELITFVQDRPGHDARYGIDPSKIKERINWQPKHNFNLALENTIKWYITHRGEY